MSKRSPVLKQRSNASPLTLDPSCVRKFHSKNPRNAVSSVRKTSHKTASATSCFQGLFSFARVGRADAGAAAAV